MKALVIKEIPFGSPIGDSDGYCIYANGHVCASDFMAALKLHHGDVPQEALQDLKESDIEFIRFRPMSPTEAKGHGLDWGVMQTDVGGYPVTAIKL